MTAEEVLEKYDWPLSFDVATERRISPKRSRTDDVLPVVLDISADRRAVVDDVRAELRTLVATAVATVVLGTIVVALYNA